jgi:hypothetical protein
MLKITVEKEKRMTKTPFTQRAVLRDSGITVV